jgi:hypothetical protein
VTASRKTIRGREGWRLSIAPYAANMYGFIRR